MPEPRKYLSDFRALWLILGVLFMRPWTPRSPAWILWLANAVLWAANIIWAYAYSRYLTDSFSSESHTHGFSSELFFGISFSSVLVNVVVGPLSHLFFILVFRANVPDKLLAHAYDPLETSFVLPSNGPTKHIPDSQPSPLSYTHTDFNKPAADSATRASQSLQMRVLPARSEAALEQAADDDWLTSFKTADTLRLTPTELFHSDQRMVNWLCVIMCIYFAMGIFAISFSNQMDVFGLRALFDIVLSWNNVVACQAVLVLPLWCRILRRRLDRYLLRACTGQFATADDLLAYHFALRSDFVRLFRYASAYMSYVLMSTALFVLSLLIYLYTGVRVVKSTGTSEQALVFTVSFVSCCMPFSVLVYAVSAVNDMHHRLREGIVRRYLYTVAERMHLISQLDMFPIAFQVFGVTLYSSTFRKVLASLLLAALPVVFRAAFFG